MTKQGRLDEALLISQELERAKTRGSEEVLRPEAPPLGDGRLKVEVQIDGTSALKIRGNEIWFDHSQGSWSKPGQHQGIFPTKLNDEVEWMPVWKEDATEPYILDWGLPTADPIPELRLRMSSGRGYAEITESANAANNFTTTITLRDAKEGGGSFGGSDWMTFRIEWKR